MFRANGLGCSPSSDLASLYDSACRDFDLDLLDAHQVHSPSPGQSSDGPDQSSATSSFYDDEIRWEQPSPFCCQDQAPSAGTDGGSAYLPAVLEAWPSPEACGLEPAPSASFSQEGHGPCGWEPSPSMHQWPPQDDPHLERRRVRAVKAHLNRQRAKESREHLRHDLDQVKAQLTLLRANKSRQRQRIAILEAHLTLAPGGHTTPLNQSKM